MTMTARYMTRPPSIGMRRAWMRRSSAGRSTDTHAAANAAMNGVST